jgi:hypothetical protein
MGGPSSTGEPPQAFSEPHRGILLQVAREALAAAAAGRSFADPNPADYPEPLGRELACFVTLEQAGELRGCIGTLRARRPIVVEVAQMARAAAVGDPRFPPVSSAELPSLDISISVLSPPVRLDFESERELLEQIRPGVDGLILRDGWHSGTFLPSVWEKLPGRREFLEQLKRKAGLPTHHWSPTVEVDRYSTECFSGPWQPPT